MAKRKLTNKQKKQIINGQRKKLDQAMAQDGLEDNTNKTTYEAVVAANYGVKIDARIFPDMNTSVFCKQRSNITPLVAGDKILLEKNDQQDFFVVAHKERETLLQRSGFQKTIKIIAANVTKAFIVIAPLPKINFNLLDKYLVAMQCSNIDSVIILNKIDLCADKHQNSDLLNKLQIYKKIGYNIIESSCKENTGLKDLLIAMQDNTSIFIGDSGVGKSSLINLIIPEEESKIGDLSSQNTGTHTTSASKMFFLESNARIIDSPGIREFGLNHLTKEDVLLGFIEFQPYITYCKYRNCKHDSNNTGCALQQAKNQGLVSNERMQSYLAIIENM